MLSAGEYVINAASTKKALPLLEAINSGKISKYASGGLVTGVTNSKVNSMASNEAKQEININITGDISRQTKREIYGMLPQIAQGVNMQNREKGYKS